MEQDKCIFDENYVWASISALMEIKTCKKNLRYLFSVGDFCCFAVQISSNSLIRYTLELNGVFCSVGLIFIVQK